jgi:hypothetical protein
MWSCAVVVFRGKLLDVCYAALLTFVEGAFRDTTLTAAERTTILCGVVLTCSCTVGADAEVTTAYVFLDTGQ